MSIAQSTNQNQSSRVLTQISRKECQDLFPEIFYNADKNWQASELLAGQGFYGQAIAVATVSLEETIKAIILQLDGGGFNFRSAKGISRFFKEHTIRYVTACLMLCIDLIGEDLLRYLKKVSTDSDTRQAFMEKAKNVPEIMSDSLMYLKSKATLMKAELPFFLSIEQGRQRGFYCDFEDVFLSPQYIGDEQYLLTREKFTRIRQFIKGFSDTFSNMEKEEISRMLESFQDGELYMMLGNYLKGTKTNELFEQFRNLLDTLENMDETELKF